jgi:hypothetical protein
MLKQVAEGVLIQQSEFCQTNTIVVQGRLVCCLSTPGYSAMKWPALANDLRELDQPVVEF